MAAPRAIRQLIATLLVFASLCPVAAWYDTGHMLVAEIAKSQLPEEDVELIDEILAGWKKDFPKSSDLVSASVWADHIKCNFDNAPACEGLPPLGMDEFSAWHFADMPYNPQHLDLTEEERNVFRKDPSALWLLTHGMRTVATSKSKWALNFVLRFLIHVVGDMHQPLHVTQGFFSNDTKLGDHPHGDAGGNLIKVVTPFKNVRSLHLLWDAAGGLYLDEWPLTPEQQKMLVKNATDLISQFPKSNFSEYGPADVEDCRSGAAPSWKGGNLTACFRVFLRWAKQGHELAEDAYDDITAGAEPSRKYLDRCGFDSRRQITLAGYRLADVLGVVAAEMRENLGIHSPTWVDYVMIGVTEVEQFLMVLGGFGLVACVIGVMRRRAVLHRDHPTLKEAFISRGGNSRV